MLRQLLVGVAVSACNIAIHAFLMAAVIWAARIAGAITTSRPSLRLITVMIATVSFLMAAHLAEILVWSLAYAIVGAESRSRNSAQGDKWNFCLTAGTLLPANQERPCRDDRAGTTHRPSRRRWHLLPSRAIERLRSLPSSSTSIPRRLPRGRHSPKAALPMCSAQAAGAGLASPPST